MSRLRTIRGTRGPASLMLILLLLLAACHREPAAPRPSVVLISLDTLRFDHLGFHGYARNTSPNLDRLSKESVVFDRAISQASSTTPAHRALFQATPASAYKSSNTTLALLLRDAGYRTAAFTGGGNLSARLGFAAGFALYDEEEGGLRVSLPRVAEWLRVHRDERAGEPFFLFLHTYDIHLPYDPPPPYNTLFSQGRGSALRGDHTRDLLRRVRKLGKHQHSTETVEIPAADRERIVALYDGGIRYTDELIGGLFDTFSELGLDDELILVVTSDHGEEFWDHGSVIHSHTVFEELVHVPMIWRLPDGRGRGTRVAAPVRLMDVAPTLVELLGLEMPPSFQGQSLVPLMDGNSEPTRPTLSEIRGLRGWTEYPWKLVLGLRGSPLLFDLESDPREQVNLYAERPEIAARLTQNVSRVTSEITAANVRELDPAAMTPALQSRLRALGYVD